MKKLAAIQPRKSSRPSPIAPAGPRHDLVVVRRLSAWFLVSGRSLPWRTEPREPYRSLVSEFMLQQTQVARVLEKFDPFLNQFPSVEALAAADEERVLSAWSGLGYYRRARLLHACAREIVSKHAGVVPHEPGVLRTLPGIGRYTAGAIASIVYGRAEPIVDGNVCRVLQRLDGKKGHAGDRAIVDWAWRRAEQLVRLTIKGGEAPSFNEGLMELGATVCVPRKPRCDVCPLAGVCVARRRGEQHLIPSAKPRAQRKIVYHNCLVVQAGDGSVLVEQRPRGGMWASMWQPPTVESSERPLSFGELRRGLGLGLVLRSGAGPAPSERVFLATHREVRFRVWTIRVGVSTDRAGARRRWVTPEALGSLSLSNAHRQILVPPPAN